MNVNYYTSLMLKKLKSYWRLPLELRRASREAFLYLTFSKILIKSIPIRFSLKYLGVKNIDLSRSDVSCDPSVLFLIRQSIYLVSKNLPWRSKCLDQAMTAQWMLSRRNLPTTLYLGMRKSDNAKKSYDAHAWVCCGNMPVIGVQPQVGYVVVGRYSFL